MSEPFRLNLHFAGRFFRYLFSGGTAAIVNIGILYILVHYGHFWYIAATTGAFIGAFCVSFALQKFFTFADRSLERVSRQLVVYLVVSLVNLVVNGLLMYVVVNKIGFEYLIAQVIVTGLIALYSFFIYRYLIFKHRPEALSVL